jgi:hypothetical protein
MTDPKRVGPGYRSPPAPTRGLSDRRHHQNDAVPPEFATGDGLETDRRRRLSVKIGAGLRFDADGTLVIDMDYVRANL